jgi:arylsulfatase A-like enzyme
LPEDGETIADALRAAGYATGLSGKWHVGYDRQRQPLQQGFDHFFGLLGGNHHYFEHMDRIGAPDLWLGNDAIQREGYTTDLITDDAIAFIETHRENPFFLYLSHAAPHFPWQGPGDQDKVIKPKHKSWQLGDRKTYIAMVERMDGGIGKVLAKLDELNLRETTLVVFTSDNGGHTYSRNAPLRGAKAEIWDGGTRVPCIACWPGELPPGKVTSQVGITMDWTATFRRLAGLATDPGGEDGIDLLPVLTGEEPMRQRSLFWRRKKGPVRKSVEEGRAVRRGRWKLVEQATGERYLFDLQSDIGETRNLLDQHSDLARKLHAELDAWERCMDCRLP